MINVNQVFKDLSVKCRRTKINTDGAKFETKLETFKHKMQDSREHKMQGSARHTQIPIFKTFTQKNSDSDFKDF